jgi:hypothetical protein
MPTMIDDVRLSEALQALHHLELQVEQHQIHVSELGAHPHEEQRARAVLDRMTAELAMQRRYCDLLERAASRQDGSRSDGSRDAA